MLHNKQRVFKVPKPFPHVSMEMRISLLNQDDVNDQVPEVTQKGERGQKLPTTQ